MKCKKCRAEIPAKQVNINTDLAHCKVCNNIFKISEVPSYNPSFDIKKNPKGTWYKRVSSNELIIGASTASPMAFFLIPFMLIWSGFSLGGIYGNQITSSEFNLFTSLFGIPFILGTLFFGGIAIMFVAGKIEITLTKQGGKIFTGVGSIGLSKKFLWSEVSHIKEVSATGYKTGLQKSRGTKISLEGNKRVAFGMYLNGSRRFYIIEALKNIHYHITDNNTLSF